MVKWIKRGLAAHLFASYFVCGVLIVSVAAMDPRDIPKDVVAWLIAWILAPIDVPIWLIVFTGQGFRPHWIGIAVCVPYLGIFGSIIFGWMRIEGKRKLLRERARLGLCRWCGYDLRGSPERCPECGRSRILGETRTEMRSGGQQ